MPPSSLRSVCFSKDLTPAPGRQAHTTSPYASAALVSRSFASTAPCPSFATMANAPLVGQDVGVVNLICPTCQPEYFYPKGWTDFLVICPSCQFVASFGGCLVGQINPSNASVHAARMRMSGAMRPDSHNPVRIGAVGGHRVGRRNRRSGMKHVAVRMIKCAGLSNRGLGPERF